MSTKKSTPRFTPAVYKISAKPGDEWAQLEIIGQRFGAPSRRIALNQKGLKVRNAQIIFRQKNKEIQHQVARINHLPGRQEVRLHTSSPLYPGSYQLTLEFKPFDIEALRHRQADGSPDMSLRELLPSFDSQEARAGAKIELN